MAAHGGWTADCCERVGGCAPTPASRMPSPCACCARPSPSSLPAAAATAIAHASCTVHTCQTAHDLCPRVARGRAELGPYTSQTGGYAACSVARADALELLRCALAARWSDPRVSRQSPPSASHAPPSLTDHCVTLRFAELAATNTTVATIAEGIAAALSALLVDIEVDFLIIFLALATRRQWLAVRVRPLCGW